MTKLTRRAVLSSAAAATLSAPFVRPAWAATPELRALMWEAYLLPDVVTAFEDTHQVKLVPSFFDGNSEAYNKLRVGGANEFDLVQADGFWPQLYFREGLIRAVDYTKVAGTAGYLPEFAAEAFTVLTDPVSGAKVGFPFCWGAYGITYDAAVVAPDQTQSLTCMFDEAWAGRLSTSSRFEENIALAALLVTAEMGTREAPRPDGKPFNPYVLTDDEMAGVEKLLIQQKGLLLTRYQDNPTLFQLLQSGAVVAATEFAQVYRQLLTATDGMTKGDFRHTLQPKEGGLGWVDTWLVTTGVADGEKMDLCNAFVDTMISAPVMKRIGEVAGCSTTVDLRATATEEERKLYLMDRSSEIAGLFMFDQPSSPEKWERVWSNVQAA
ncbi:ABC transporter substrate-binding protein [Cypionkella psychrotolerans]|uniref:ABC transporter substrate-binding protein n=1 Tax=Cypionkella psychrotolerans TaxID=1678131 RepID=UPI0009E79ADC|nr:extracellular solute-binding protein [Cypionkella psychrotolerans]